MRITAGTLLTLETGEYSDFTYHGPFRVVRDFDQQEVINAFLAAWPTERTRCNSEEGWPRYDEDDAPPPSAFAPFLTRLGYIEDLPSVSWHVGSYGRFEAKANDDPS